MSTESSETPGSGSFENAKAFSDLVTSTSETKKLPERISTEEIRVNVPPVGGTEIILQRHGKYIRDMEDPRVGCLTPESHQDQVTKGKEFLSELINTLPEDQRDAFDILIVASDTQYGNGGRRSFETAEAIQEGMSAALDEAGLGRDRILNNVNPVRTLDGDRQTGGPRATPSLREPQMLYNEEFNTFLADTYGPQTLQYWIAFEEDRHEQERLQMGAEGPDDIVDRTADTVNVLSRYASVYHHAHPGRRLIIWAATHYDTISPFVKLKLAEGDKEDALPVDYGAGIGIDITTDGHATSTIAGTTYEVPLRQRG